MFLRIKGLSIVSHKSIRLEKLLATTKGLKQGTSSLI